MNETRWIPGFENLYSMDKRGQVYNKHGRPLKMRRDTRCLRYRLHKDGIERNVAVSKLLKWTFK